MADGFNTFWDFESKLKKDSLGKLFSFFGDETFLRRRALSLLRRTILVPGEEQFNFLSLDLADTSLDDFLHQARTIPMLTSQRLMILRQSDRMAAAELPRLEAYLQHPPGKTAVVFDFEPSFIPRKLKSEKDKKLLALMDRHTAKCQFGRLKPSDLGSFLFRFAQEEKYRFDCRAIEYLIERLGGDLELIVHEMEKLYLLAGPATEVQREDMERLMVKHPYATVFDLLDDLAARNARQVVNQLSTLLDSGEHPLGILAMVSRFLQQAMMYKSLRTRGAKEQEILSRLSKFFRIGMQPFQLKNLEKAHCNFSAPDLWHGLTLVGQAEEQFKSMHVDPGQHLELLLVRLCRVGTD
jgi:DNA polymerase-3 subunit delta